MSAHIEAMKKIFEKKEITRSFAKFTYYIHALIAQWVFSEGDVMYSSCYGAW